MDFPESKEALLEVLREKWEIEPCRMQASLISQTTPRYFKLSDNGQHCDPLASLEALLDKTVGHPRLVTLLHCYTVTASTVSIVVL
jgi:hypothetical protein